MNPRIGSLLIVAALALSAQPAIADGSLLQPREQSDRILPVDEAFRVQPALWQNGQLIIGIDAAPGCYLYRDKFGVVVLAPANLVLGKSDLRAGETHHDEHFGEVRVFRDRLLARYKTPSATPPQKVRIRYQGCAENLVCYPPQERVLTVETVR
ncbi:MAG: hypothetical protein JWQ90_2247 [Hydrocarboniphaga sp.]|uniref:protein-disulfide reductase DsbD N-terminal domain-containing protein n=1 Tax=Hydrocarboniphaga sp. TaxID=2033016 RepID=UPI00262EDBBC|nr:protein-disulfide reductase DsbD N-terminal domain-containing protein [Hydrocarboniphaga sp.]MDB5969797.1 hypothetical protein [Hydrocarboniphaga sp.]